MQGREAFNIEKHILIFYSEICGSNISKYVEPFQLALMKRTGWVNKTTHASKDIAKLQTAHPKRS